MDSPWIRIRLASTAALLYLAYRASPQATKPIIKAMAEGFDSVPDQLLMGRTWGVIMSCWAVRSDVLAYAEELHDAGSRAMARKRLEIERRVRQECT